MRNPRTATPQIASGPGRCTARPVITTAHNCRRARKPSIERPELPGQPEISGSPSQANCTADSERAERPERLIRSLAGTEPENEQYEGRHHPGRHLECQPDPGQDTARDHEPARGLVAQRPKRCQRQVRKDQHQLEVLPLAEEADHQPERAQQEGGDECVPGAGADRGSAKCGQQGDPADSNNAAHEDTKAQDGLESQDSRRGDGQGMKEKSERWVEVDQVGVKPGTVENAPSSVQQTRGVTAHRIAEFTDHAGERQHQRAGTQHCPRRGPAHDRVSCRWCPRDPRSHRRSRRPGPGRTH